jgi:hypothetical protein
LDAAATAIFLSMIFTPAGTGEGAPVSHPAEETAEAIYLCLDVCEGGRVDDRRYLEGDIGGER